MTEADEDKGRPSLVHEEQGKESIATIRTTRGTFRKRLWKRLWKRELSGTTAGRRKFTKIVERCELNLVRSDAFRRRLEGGVRAMGEASASDDHIRRGTR